MASQGKHQEILDVLGRSFDWQVVHDPSFLTAVPRGAYIALQIAVPESASAGIFQEIAAFNDWSLAIARSHLGVGQAMCIAACTLRPLVIGGSESLDSGTLRAACDSYELVGA